MTQIPETGPSEVARLRARVTELESALKRADDALQADRGRVERLLGHGRDILAQLPGASQLLQALIRSLHETFLVGWDTQGIYRFLWFPDDLKQRYGLPVDALVGQPLSAVFPPEEAAVRTARLQEIARTGEPWREEYRLDSPAGAFWHDITIGPMRDDAGQVQYLLGVGRDVTASKEAEARRRKALVDGQDTERLESLAVLAGGVAHDFNNLLQGILGEAQLLHEELDDAGALREGLSRIEGVARKASELTAGLLAFSGGGGFATEPVALSGVIQAALIRVARAEPRLTDLAADIPPDLGLVRGDAAQLRRVIENLLANAADATRSGGEIRVSARACTAEEVAGLADELLGALAGGACLMVAVQDTGGGMDEPTRRHVFDPFFTDKATGRGLGLAEVLGIVRSHGGACRVISHPGRGTRFEVLLPRFEPKEAFAATPVPAVVPMGGPVTILVADDEPMVRRIACRALQRAGYRTLEASDGREAVERFREQGDEISALVLDVTMPRMSGEEAFHVIRTMRADVPVLFSSGYAEALVMERLRGAKGVDFLQKPYRPSVLITRVGALVDG